MNTWGGGLSSSHTVAHDNDREKFCLYIFVLSDGSDSSEGTAGYCNTDP